MELLHNILQYFLNESILLGKESCVDGLQIQIRILMKILVRQRPQNGLDVADGQKILKIVNKDHQKNMVSGILLLVRRRQQMILRVVVDHGLGHDLVIFKTDGFGKMPGQECCNLVYI